MKLRVLLPAYNEEQSLPPLIKRLENFKSVNRIDMDIFVVNDGSRDKTLDVIKNFKGGIDVKYFDQQPNQGLAAAMRNGFTKAMDGLANDDVIITMDADDSHDPEAITAMLAKLEEGNDVVIASRYQPGSEIHGLSNFRKLLSLGAGLLFRLFAPVRGAKDYTCGYRALRVSLLKRAMDHFGASFIEQQGFACTPEILLKLNVLKPKVTEVPFILRYDQKQGESKMNVSKTIRQALVLLWKSWRFK